MNATSAALACLEHGTPGLDAVLALQLQPEWFQESSSIGRLLDVCLAISLGNDNDNARLLLVAATEICLVCADHDDALAKLAQHLALLCVEAHHSTLRACTAECLKEIELVHPGLLTQELAPTLFERLTALQQQQLPEHALLLLTLAAHLPPPPPPPPQTGSSVLSKSLDSLSSLSAWGRCEAVHLMRLLLPPPPSPSTSSSSSSVSQDGILANHHRVLDGLCLPASPACLDTLLQLQRSSSSSSSSSTALRRQLEAHAFDPVDYILHAVEMAAAAAAKQQRGGGGGDYAVVLELTRTLLVDFWREDGAPTLARRVFAVYRLLLAHYYTVEGEADDGVDVAREHIQRSLVGPLVDNLVHRARGRRTGNLPLLCDLLRHDHNEMLLVRAVANALLGAEDLMALAHVIKTVVEEQQQAVVEDQVVRALDQFVDQFAFLPRRANWDEAQQLLDLCAWLLLRRQHTNRARSVAVRRVVRKLELKSPLDVVLREACARAVLPMEVEVAAAPKEEEEEEGEEKEDAVVAEFDFQGLLRLERVDADRVAVEWPVAEEGEDKGTYLLALEIRVDVEHTSSSCYDFQQQQQHAVAVLPVFRPGQRHVFAFSLPPTSSSCMMPVRVFFRAAASVVKAAAEGVAAVEGPLGSISIELHHLFQPMLPAAAAAAHTPFVPTTRYFCECAAPAVSKEWVEDMVIQRLFGEGQRRRPFKVHYKEEAEAEAATWRVTVRLPPRSHLAFLFVWKSTQRLTVRCQTDAWIVLPELDRLFQPAAADTV